MQDQQKQLTERDIQEMAAKQGYSPELLQKAKAVGHPINLSEQVTEKEISDINSRHEMLKFAGLEVADGTTRFINIDYNQGNKGRKGRTLIVLGNFGLHARITGEHQGKIWNERLGINEQKETDWDVTISCKREFVFHVSVSRIKQDYSNSNLSAKELETAPEYLYTLTILHTEGNIQLTGLKEEMANTFKKMVWTWMIFHNQSISHAQS